MAGERCDVELPLFTDDLSRGDMGEGTVSFNRLNRLGVEPQQSGERPEVVITPLEALGTSSGPWLGVLSPPLPKRLDGIAQLRDLMKRADDIDLRIKRIRRCSRRDGRRMQREVTITVRPSGERLELWVWLGECSRAGFTHDGREGTRTLTPCGTGF